MVRENPTWGEPRIHGELQMLGFDISERTISRWMRRAPRDPEPRKRWLAFLRNQKIDSARPLCRAPVLDEVNSLVRIRAESPRFHYVRGAAFRFIEYVMADKNAELTEP